MKHILFFCLFSIFIININVAQSWTGTWSTDFGDLRLHSSSNTFYGDYKDVGIIDGYQQYSNQYQGKFTNGTKEGWFKFKLNGEKFTGTWGWKGKKEEGKWNGKRINKTKPLLSSKVISGTWKTPFGDLSVIQKGLAVTGSFKDGGTLAGAYDVSTKKITGSLFVNNKSMSFYIFQKPRTDDLWVGKYEKPRQSGMKTSWYLKSPREMTTAEFKTLPQNKVSTSSTHSTTLNSKVNKRTSSLLKTRKQRTKDEIEGTYIVTLTRLITNVNGSRVVNESKLEMYGSITIRLFGEGESGRVQIRPTGNRQDRVFEASKKDPLVVRQNDYAVGTVDSQINEERLLYKGEHMLDRSRMFKVKGDLANSNLEFVITQQLNIDRYNSDLENFPRYGKLKINQIEFGKEYFTYEVLEDLFWVGFIIEKVN